VFLKSLDPRSAGQRIVRPEVLNIDDFESSFLCGTDDEG
jgi:hypothetical protein